MFNYQLTISDDKGNTVTKFELERGESKKGTYATVSAKAGNKVVPFGKLYVAEDAIKESKKAEAKQEKKGQVK